MSQLLWTSSTTEFIYLFILFCFGIRGPQNVDARVTCHQTCSWTIFYGIIRAFTWEYWRRVRISLVQGIRSSGLDSNEMRSRSQRVAT